MRKGIPDGEQQREAAWQSVRELRGRMLDVHELRRNMRRLVANWHFIADGAPVPWWDGRPETGDAQIVALRPAMGRDEDHEYYRARLLLKTGIP